MNPIKNKVLSFSAFFPHQNKWAFWFLLAFAIKLVFFAYKVIELAPIANTHYPAALAREAGDTFTYIQPVENLLNKGSYEDDFRMPGYAWLFFLLRIIFPLSLSLDVLVTVQLILSALSVYVLAKISSLLFQKSNYFYVTFFFYSLSTFVSLYDPILLTESFSTSALIFSIYLLILPEKNFKNLFASGLFLTWCIFLKPVMLPLLVFYMGYILLHASKQNVLKASQKLRLLFYFSLSFILIDGAWILRNYGVHKRIYPLTTSLYFASTTQSYLGSLFDFMNAFGGSIVWWEPGAEITFFKPLPGNIKKQKTATLPQNIYTKEFNVDSLLLVKNMISIVDNAATDSLLRISLTAEIKEKLNRYTLSIKHEKPFLYYVSSRLKACKTFFVHSGTYNLFNKSSSDLNPFAMLLKIGYSLLYAFVVLFGFIGLFYFLIRFFSNYELLFFTFTGLYTALAFPLLLKFDEYRYFVTAYPLFLIAGIFTSLSIFGILKNKYAKNA